mgnify:CR=1 FL=1
MKHAYVFPGQGAQAVGMGKDLYDNVPEAKALFEQANEILGFRITDIMFAGTDEELKQTKVTQPAVFLHSVIMAKALGVKPDAVAGHSLGEFSALVVAGALSFEDGLRLVSKRAMAMQKACEATPSTMAAVLALPDEKVEEICASIEGEVVVCANYNCPGQIVITGEAAAVAEAGTALKETGARRVLPLKVSGPFHSPMMRPAGEELAKVFAGVSMNPLKVPYVANINAEVITDCGRIEGLLVDQVSGSVRWQQSVETMLREGVDTFVEIGPGKTLTGFLRKIDKNVKAYHIGSWEEAVQVCEELK